MKRILFAIFTALLGFTGVSAQVRFTPIEFTAEEPASVELETGINYYTFTAPEDGLVEFNVGWTSTLVYQTDAQGTEDTKVMLAKEIGSDGNLLRMQVEAGSVYYVSTSIVTDPVTMTVGYTSAVNELKVSANYVDGEVFNMTGRNLEITIDRQATIERTLVVLPDGSEEDVPTNCINSIFVTQYYYTITLRDLMNYLMDGGKIAVGDKFTIRLEGIADANDPSLIYGEDGSFSVTLELGEMPATLLSISPADGSTIYTYYPEDGDEGLFIFNFSEPLNEDKTGVTAMISWGDMEAGSYEAYYPDFTIEGSKVTVDIRGIRIPETVAGSRGMAGNTTVSMSITGLSTPDGRDVETNYPNSGSSGIMAFYPVVKEEITFIYDFIPQNGNTSLEGYDEIAIWTNVPVMYDGITLTWFDARGGERSRTFTPEQVPFEWDDYEEGYLAHVSLRGISYNKTPVTVTVDNAYLMNGDPVTITGTFNNTGTGIDGVTAADPDRVVKVYAVDGTFVKEGKAGEVLGGLKKGVYITEGKKVLVK